MSEEKLMRLGQVARKLNIGKETIIEHLAKKGFEVDRSPNTKITSEQYTLLAKEFASSLLDKEEAEGLTIGLKNIDNLVIERIEGKQRKRDEDEEILIENITIASGQPEVAEQQTPEEPEEEKESARKGEAAKLPGIKIVGKIDLDTKRKPKDVKTGDSESAVEEKAGPETPDQVVEPEIAPKEVIEAKADKLKGLKVVGKINLPKVTEKERPVASSDEAVDRKKKKRPRKRIASDGIPERQRARKKEKHEKEEHTDKEIQEQIKATLAKLSGGSKKTAGAKYRREKRASVAEAKLEALEQEQEAAKTLKVTEFVAAGDLASLMEVDVNDVIAACMNMGMFVSINQRLDAEAITLIADEFGYGVSFASAEEETEVIEDQDPEDQLQPRAPIVTIMGHVDHGKTSLLDYIRQSKVVASEAGGITQHIGAYDVATADGHKIAFLDTPGHEAFTAMRARGAQVTDLVIIVVAADDNVMPQTKEAINHAQVAGVPIVIAINKIDKPNANVEKIKEGLANIKILVEDWGGKYQCQEISAKTGQGIDELLEKVLLEAELLELKANPDRAAAGTVIEASLDKGRGFLATLLVQTGTLNIGDVLLAGSHFGRVKALYDHTGEKLKSAVPSTPVQLLGLNGAPQAGDKFNIMSSEREAREIATKRGQILREQSIRTQKHITLDEIGRRLAIGSFKELNLIVKADVDGSVEALSDSLLKLSTDEIQINVIHKAVGQISESDVLLASASDAVILGFQVRPSVNARKIAETEEIDMRLYSVIYDAINDVKDAMEGLLSPTVEEVILGNAEVREIFKISRIGTVAGCMLTDGLIKRKNQIRLIRDGVVIYTGHIAALKRFKEDVNEVKSGYECGISIENYNDIKVGDMIEAFEEQETKRSL